MIVDMMSQEASQIRRDSWRDQQLFTAYPATTKEDYEFINRMCEQEQRVIGANMVTHVGPVVKPGFIIGWLNGQRVGCASACKFGEAEDDLIVFGLTVLDNSKGLRGKGYGKQLIQAVLAPLLAQYQSDQWNIAGNVYPSAISTLAKIYNITTKIQIKLYLVSCTNIIQALRPHSYAADCINIKPIDQVDFDKLAVYDTSVFGFPRHEFLKRWITIPQSTGFVATNKNGDIVGYGVMQPTLINNREQIIGPLYSDNESITRSLLYTLAKAAIDPQMGGANTVRLMVPTETNPGVAELMEKEIGCDSFVELVRLYSKAIPPSQVYTVRKVVAVSTAAFE